MVKIKLKTNSPHLSVDETVEVEELKAKELVNSGMYIYANKAKVKELEKKVEQITKKDAIKSR